MNFLKYAILGVFLVIAIVWVLVWFGVIPGLRSDTTTTTKKTELRIWGVDDEAVVISRLAANYNVVNPGIKVIYEKKSKATFEDEFIRAFAAGKGPDIISVHHTWLNRYKDVLYPAPKSIFSVSDFRKSFLDVAQTDFISNNELYATALYVDTLALYYNIDLFNSAGIVLPPVDWEEFAKYAKMLTKRKSGGDILVSGAAFGGGKNIENSADILALLMLQNGATISDPVSGKISFKSESPDKVGSPAEKALEFYTSFAKQNNTNYSWSKNFASGEDIFSQNKAAMIIGYSRMRDNLFKKYAKLRFSVANVPQAKNAVLNKNYPDYWGYGVYKNAKNKDLAWEFLRFISRPDSNKLYLSLTHRPASQKELIISQQNSPDSAIFASQALSAYSWKQLNNQIITKVFQEMIDTQLGSDQLVSQTLKDAETKLAGLLKTGR